MVEFWPTLLQRIVLIRLFKRLKIRINGESGLVLFWGVFEPSRGGLAGLFQTFLLLHNINMHERQGMK